MLLELDQSIEDNLDNFTSSDWESIENLAKAGRNGYHFLTGHRSLMEKLSSNDKLSRLDQYFFKRKAINYSTESSIPEIVTTRISISYNNPIHISNQEEPDRIFLALSFFTKLEGALATRLICENISDYKILIELAKIYARLNRIKSFNIKFREANGGGSCTAQVIENKLNHEGKIILCVVDSDKSSSSCKIGETAKKVSSVCKMNNHRPIKLVILQARELENLLPVEFYKKNYTGTDYKRSNDILETIRTINSCSLLYLDYKEGLNLRTLTSDKVFYESPEWKIVLKQLKDGAFNIPKTTECLLDGSCSDPDNCNCEFVRGYGSKVLETAITILEREGISMYREADKALLGSFNSLAKLVFDWGFASPELHA